MGPRRALLLNVSGTAGRYRGIGEGVTRPRIEALHEADSPSYGRSSTHTLAVHHRPLFSALPLPVDKGVSSRSYLLHYVRRPAKIGFTDFYFQLTGGSSTWLEDSRRKKKKENKNNAFPFFLLSAASEVGAGHGAHRPVAEIPRRRS